MHDPRTSSTLVELLRARASRRPEHVVYTYLFDGEREEGSFGYAELDRRARSVAVHLAERGVEPGDRVLLAYDSGLRFVAAFFGCLYAGAVAVPGYPPRAHKSLPEQNLTRLSAMAGDCAPALLLASSEVLGRMRASLPELPHLGGLVALASDELERGEPERWSMPAIDGGSLALLQYTSGSTGEPKGAMLTHANLMANLGQIQRSWRMDGEPTICGWLPLHHDMGLIAQLLAGLHTGGRVVFMSPASFVQRPMLWMRAIAKYAGNVAMGPDFGYRLVLRAVRPEDVAKLELAQLRSVCNGAEPVRADTLAEFSRVFAPAGFLPEHHYPSYGLAEASALVSGWHPGEPPTLVHLDAAELERDGLREVEPGHPNARTLVGCGRPAEDVGVVVVDPSTRARCAPDRVGEIWVSGPNVARGYWRRPDVTAAAFGARTIDGAGPFYRTGDLGFLKDGHVFIAGRLKDLVIIDGRNHYPQDIEQTLEGAYPDLRSGGGAVFSVDDGRAERLVVVSEIARGTDGAFDVEAAARAVRGAVSRMHDVAPSEVVFLTAGGLPKTSSGKVQRRACRHALRAGELPIVGRIRYEEE